MGVGGLVWGVGWGGFVLAGARTWVSVWAGLPDYKRTSRPQHGRPNLPRRFTDPHIAALVPARSPTPPPPRLPARLSPPLAAPPRRPPRSHTR